MYVHSAKTIYAARLARSLHETWRDERCEPFDDSPLQSNPKGVARVLFEKSVNPEGVEARRNEAAREKRLNPNDLTFILNRMPQSLAKILIHTIFSTKDRRPFLKDQELRGELHHYLGGVLNHLGCQPIIVGGVEDHVHVLCDLGRTCEPAAMVKELKRASSLWLKTKGPQFHDFAWQSGYGMFSLDSTQVESIRQYIAGQEEHHRQVLFQDELREFLRKNDVPFDERYVWD
jgi:putative transposase